ncbi:Nuclear rim protein 1 [Candida viswanathii]|uniref:Nuclear rim protein 1 n=1 Tax=Candida viswanathii TaxID=5486 RepID=A0A367Y150_9ASCO|nr:Nuclear rim protein 1 [Candida viswanathii]
MSKKHIRRQSLISKIQSFPFDIWLYLHEINASIDWDDYSHIIALPLGISLTLIFFIVASILNYYNFINLRSKNILFNSDYYQYEYLKNDIIHNTFDKAADLDEAAIETPLTTSILWIMNGANTAIFAVLITAKRNYGLLYCKLKPRSKNVFKSSFERISFVVEILAFVLKFFQNDDDDEGDTTYEGDTTAEVAGDNEIWHLNVWDPSKFALYLFIGLNPVNLYLVYYLMSDVSHLYLLFLLALVSGFNYVFIEKFLNLVNDKQILYQEMFQEYNKKFVQPKTNILKKDAMVDATMGPFYLSSLNDNRPYAFSKLKVFVTHDMKGNAITEYGELDSQILPQQLEPSTSACTSVLNLRIPSRTNSVLYDDNRSFTGSNWQNSTFQNVNPRLTTVSGATPSSSFYHDQSKYSAHSPTLTSTLSYNRQPNLEFNGYTSSRDNSPPRFKSPSPIHRSLQLHHQSPPSAQPFSSNHMNNVFRSPSPTRRRPSDSPSHKPSWR